jgi:hypothetical protein
MLASKIICDDTYSNKLWCIVGQGMFFRPLSIYFSVRARFPDYQRLKAHFPAARGLPATVYLFQRLCWLPRLSVTTLILTSRGYVLPAISILNHYAEERMEVQSRTNSRLGTPVLTTVQDNHPGLLFTPPSPRARVCFLRRTSYILLRCRQVWTIHD